MGTLRYGVMACSLDGYVADGAGGFEWTHPSDEVYAFLNQVVTGERVFVMGRRMWETMRVWDSWEVGKSAIADEFVQIWEGADKIVCSGSIAPTPAPRTTFEPRLTTARLAEIVAATDGVVDISGPTMAADALRAGMVDEVHMIVVPRVVGGGLRLFPDGLRLSLELVEKHSFESGSVYLRYGGARD